MYFVASAMHPTQEGYAKIRRFLVLPILLEKQRERRVFKKYIKSLVRIMRGIS